MSDIENLVAEIKHDITEQNDTIMIMHDLIKEKDAEIDRLTIECNVKKVFIEKLEKRVKELEEQIEKNNIYKTENERLRKMLNIKDTYKEFELVAANVTSRDSSTWFLSIIIDKGTDDGLSMTDTVITPYGLVGHITDIGSNWAMITTILDSQSTVAVMVERTEDFATVDGDVDLAANSLCKMTYIPKDSTITVGDTIKTSGLGGVYPKGINVGKITKIHPENKGVSQYAEVEPYVDFNRLYEVFVITN